MLVQGTAERLGSDKEIHAEYEPFYELLRVLPHGYPTIPSNFLA